MSEHGTETGIDELGAEVPAEDALEQRHEVTGTGDADEALTDAPDDSDPADRAEQARAVDTAEDEYR